MLTSFEAILSQIKASSYPVHGNPLFRPNAFDQRTNTRASMIKPFQSNFRESSPSRNSLIKDFKERSQEVINSPKFVVDKSEILLVNLRPSESQELHHQKIEEEVIQKLQLSKLHPCTAITLEELSRNYRILCKKKQINDNSNVKLKENIDDKVLKSKFQKKEKVTIKSTTQEENFQASSLHESPLKGANVKTGHRDRSKKLFYDLSDLSLIKRGKETNEVESSSFNRTSTVENDMSIKGILDESKKTQSSSISPQIVKNKIQLSIQDFFEIQLKRGRTTSIFIPRESEHKYKKSVDKAAALVNNDNRLSKMNANKKKNKQELYRQIATEDERERISSFLKDEYVNELLLNRYHKDLDKFQIRDVLNGAQQKAEQDKEIRLQFIRLLKNNESVESPQSRRDLSKIGVRNSVRKQIGLSFTNDQTEYSIQTNETKDKENDRAKIQVKDNVQSRGSKLRKLIFSKLLEAKTENKDASSEDYVPIKSARSNEGEDNVELPELQLGNRTYSQQMREMDRIRLLKVTKALNDKLNKTVLIKSEISEIPVFLLFIKLIFQEYSSSLAINKQISEIEEGYIFFKASKEGDYKTIENYLKKNSNLVFAYDTV